MEMKFSRGDRVKFLNDTGGGIVKEIKDSKMAIVLIDDGFEVPVLISELIPVGGSVGSGQGIAEKVNDPDESDSDTRFERIPSGEMHARHKPLRNLLLGLVGSKSNENLEVWLVNDSRFSVLYSVMQKDESSYLNLKTGYIEHDTKILVRSFTREQINSFVTLRLQALFFMRGVFDPVAPSQAEYGMDPVEIYSDGALTVNDFFDGKAIIIPLISDSHELEKQKLREQEVNRLAGLKGNNPRFDHGPGGSTADPLVEEVDLHIEELVEDHSGLSGREVLDLQMARFTTALEGALRGKIKRIVFIHGVGNGKLKYEIRKALDRKYSKLTYQDASFREYGYGATMVIIRK